jgi:hypothetical protein
MLGLLSLLAFATLVYFSAAIAREYGKPAESVSMTGWGAAAVIAFARLAILFACLPLMDANLSYPVGLIVLLLVLGSSGVETRVMWALHRHDVRPSFLFATLIIVTSIPLGFVWAWIRTRPRSGRTA